LGRFLSTHALVGLAHVLARYPFEETWARWQLEEWARAGRVVAVRSGEVAETLQWSAPDNLEQVQRGSLAILRREVVTCAPPQFADFLLRWQGVHPDLRHGGKEGLVEALDRLQGLPLAAELWEQTVLPARVPGYQPRWLDEWVSGGSGAWVCRGEDDSELGLLAFFRREDLGLLPPPLQGNLPALEETASRVLECLQARGACFVTDLAGQVDLPPSTIRSALGTLLRRGLVTNDHFDMIRHGADDLARGGLASGGSNAPGSSYRGVNTPR